MKIGFLSYPMFAQTQGGLEIQIVETLAALGQLGVNCSLIDTRIERLSHFDLVHVFAAGSGNFRMLQFAQLLDVPAVLSPLIRPHWTRSLGRRARLGDWLVGRLTKWEVKSEYREVEMALQLADLIVALGPLERASIRSAFGIPDEKIEVVPNGIPARFFASAADPFVAKFGLAPGFVLMVASIDPHKNQLGMAHALAGCGVPLVMIGECHGANRDYLGKVLAVPGTRHLGSMRYDDPLLPAAYAAAGVFCLPSQSEVMPLSVLESLAAGTPAVMTRNHGMDMTGLDACITEVDPNDPRSIREAVEQLLARPPSAEQCQRAVAHLKWETVAHQLVKCYERVLAARKHRAAAQLGVAT